MTTALLVIDVQQSFVAHDSWADISNPRLAEDLVPLVAASRARGDVVIWVLHTDPGSGGVFDPTQGHVRLIGPLSPEPQETVLHKTSHNAFTSTDLQQRLDAAGIRRIRVVGIRTEQCVETTARVASDLGYEVRFVVDGTATQPLGGLSAEQIIERTVTVLDGRFAEIETLAEAISDPGPGSKQEASTRVTR
ncbi:MAG: isochorismatase family protein [Propionibacteriales bacterium]|nr:isochorismatase family protein [Propionibacteriales bacterium]